MAKFKRAASSQSPAERITEAIIDKLEQGTKPWIKPWRGQPVSRPLRACGVPYRGMNVNWVSAGSKVVSAPAIAALAPASAMSAGRM